MTTRIDLCLPNHRTKLALEDDLYHKMVVKAREMDISISEYIRRLAKKDLGITEPLKFTSEPKFSNKTERLVEYNVTKGTNTRFNVTKEAVAKLLKICYIEGKSRDKVINDLLMWYEPVPKPEGKYDFYPLSLNMKGHLNRDVIYFHINSVYPYKDAKEDYEKGRIDWNRYKEAFLKRLEEPDAQEKIKEYLQIVKKNDVYVISIESEKKESLRDVLCEYLRRKNEMSALR